MPRPVIRLQGLVQSLRFCGQPTELPVYDWSGFDINNARPACKVRLPDGAEIALSKWTGPKRTRTYPLAKVYDTYSHSGKIVTVIPIIKDEGKGERENDTNLDQVNFITLSWMNLMGVYVVLAWYSDASKKDSYRITHQRMENAYVHQKIEEIARYKMDAHHWNRDHFVDKFLCIYERAIQSYSAIAQRLGVQLHSQRGLRSFLDTVRSTENPHKLDLAKYAEHSLSASERAALRETITEHALERSQAGSAKGFFEIRNYLGGVYYLTADEVIFECENQIVIQESKNSTKHFLPSLSDVKDGLFKLLLFSQLQQLQLGKTPLLFRTRLRLTGAFRGKLSLPAETEVLEAFCRGRKQPARSKLTWLNEELRRLGIEGVLEGNDA
ncbi:MAG: hypothetical protein NZ585_07700 [Chloracidobacterium sp.]|nr:hypothetical protein [Chloracidobacterium sp.]MDW8218105.1 hypothetical protein [Acidobacteriota bacterium]